MSYVLNLFIAALQFLLTSGCDPNISSDKSNLASPLHFAVSGGHAECVQMLIENGANINAIMISEEVMIYIHSISDLSVWLKTFILQLALLFRKSRKYDFL